MVKNTQKNPRRSLTLFPRVRYSQRAFDQHSAQSDALLAHRRALVFLGPVRGANFTVLVTDSR